MDSKNPKEKPAQLLSDLESIRRLLEPAIGEPPLLTDSFDPQNIPLLSDIVTPAYNAKPLLPIPPPPASASTRSPAVLLQTLELNRLQIELRTAAQLMMQDVIDDFVPQIEAELNRRLQARLELLLKQTSGSELKR